MRVPPASTSSPTFSPPSEPRDGAVGQGGDASRAGPHGRSPTPRAPQMRATPPEIALHRPSLYPETLGRPPYKSNPHPQLPVPRRRPCGFLPIHRKKEKKRGRRRSRRRGEPRSRTGGARRRHATGPTGRRPACRRGRRTGVPCVDREGCSSCRSPWSQSRPWKEGARPTSASSAQTSPPPSPVLHPSPPGLFNTASPPHPWTRGERRISLPAVELGLRAEQRKEGQARGFICVVLGPLTRTAPPRRPAVA
jgi:hypothetical protein